MKNLLNPVHHVKRAVRFGRRAKRAVDNRRSIARDFTFSVDSPRKRTHNKRTILVEGWIISKKDAPFTLRVTNNGVEYPVTMDVKRLDVAKAHPHLDREKTLHSGFRAEFAFDDGEIAIEVDKGRGFKKLYSAPIMFAVEKLPAAIYNKDLSNNYPEHINLLENRKRYYYEDPAEANYDRHPKDTRLVAMYLPQFHPIPENDRVWGKGFTEWTNVTGAQARFVGHQQPVLPKDLGFYDLRLESNLLDQIELAKKYGVYGFCFYYYWFSGRRLLERPLDSFLKHKEWDFNFVICWANENWTKRWDGRDNDIIVAQQYLDSDPLQFIKDVEDTLLDPRYITEDGKPVLMVYRASELKDPERYVKTWREYFRKQHKKELHLVSFLSFDDQDPREYGFDMALDFAPLSSFFKNDKFPRSQFPHLDVGQKLLDVNFSGVVADYRNIALNDKLDQAFDFPLYSCVTPSWDNDARKNGGGFVFQNSSPDIYAQWLYRVVKTRTAEQDSPLVFVNAWNEWAEGAMMEPSMHLGHATLNRTAEVLSAFSHNKKNAQNFPAYGLKRRKDRRLAVVVHLFYPDMWPSIRERLAHISEPYDLFVSLSERDADFVPEVDSKDTNVSAYVVPNRGRDVLPFLFMARSLRAAGYEYVLKIHSKKSKHRADGSTWFGEVIESLLPNKSVIKKTMALLEKPDTGVIGPRDHLVSLKRHMGSNAVFIESLLGRAYDPDKATHVLGHTDRYPYFGGTMFWARLEALDPLLDLYLLPDDFQSEHGQVDGTTAHAVERLLGIIPALEGKKLYYVSAAGTEVVPEGSYTDKYRYAP